MEVMKRLLLLLVCSGAWLSAADLSTVHSVYVMPMFRGMDQYLVNRLTTDHVFQVVVDPKQADAVITDRLGDSLQTQMETLWPTPKPEAAEKPAKAEKAPKGAKAEDEPQSAKMITDTVNKLENPAANSTFGRGKGTIFLVDTKSRAVLWSTYDPSKGSDSKEMDRTASDIVNRLKKDLSPGKK
jgi:hypothetical protein